jgi:hypothetical protein
MKNTEEKKIRHKFQINPGREKIILWNPSDAIEGLKEIVRVLDENPEAWQSIKSPQDKTPYIARLLERAKSQALDVLENSEKESPQILVISPSSVPRLAHKIEAAIQALGALKRQAPNHVFNASVLYPDGPVAIIANPKGRRQISHCRELLDTLQQEQATHPSR